VLMRRICIRYEDGRKVCFVPEAGEEYFSQDDAHRVVGMLHKGTEVLECAPYALPWRPRWRGRTNSTRQPSTAPRTVCCCKTL
jgi:hypothetical protein